LVARDVSRSERTSACRVAKRDGFSSLCGASGTDRVLKVEVGGYELDLAWASRGDGKLYAPHTGAHLRPEREDVATNNPGGGISQLSKAQTETVQGIHANIGNGENRMRT
jgi:hypothetical protein